MRHMLPIYAICFITRRFVLWLCDIIDILHKFVICTLQVQFLEQAEAASVQRIRELEDANQLLQQRLDLKEDLDTDILLLETLKDKITILEDENRQLNSKISELEENEEILKNNWLKVAENDANRVQIYENKIKNLENLNSELKGRLKDLQETSVNSINAPSLATELSGSFKFDHYDGSVSKEEFQQKLTALEEELNDLRDKKDSTIEGLQEKLGKLRDNEIKLSESLMECEQNERELRSKLAIYEQRSSSAEQMIQYEGKIRQMQNSREDLLDRLDSMEDHEVNLKNEVKGNGR